MNIIKIINEEISAISKPKDKEIFDYHYITNGAWSEKVKEANNFQKIAFDLENNETTGQKKTFYLKKNLRKDQPVKYEINAELMEAGGDWEMPVMYFRLQIINEYGLIKSDDWKKSHKPEYIWDMENKGELRNCYVIIPPIDAGNKLKKADSDKYEWRAFDNSEVSREQEKEIRLKDEDKKNAWKWLAELLEKVIDERHEVLD